MWEVWKPVATAPNDLRYLARVFIINDDTHGIMDNIGSRHSEAQSAVEWPGTTFGIDTEEGLALLGTPDGLAAGFTLADHAKELGKRKVSVTIRSRDPNKLRWGYCMHWDTGPLRSRPTTSTAIVAHLCRHLSMKARTSDGLIQMAELAETGVEV